MAVAYGTFASAEGSSGSITITKPTSTADGDMLIAVVTTGDGSSGAITSTGWTLLESTTFGASGSVGRVSVLFKIAGGSEPANYTFTGGSYTMLGGIIRATGASFSGAVNFVSASQTVTASTTPSFTPGITPLGANTLFVMAMASDGNSGDDISGYAIATSDPTWTERLDAEHTSSSNTQLAIATAIRSEGTASGNYSMSHSTGAGTNYGGVILSVQENTNETGTHSHLAVSPSLYKPTPSSTVTATHTHLAVEPTVNAPSAVLDNDGGWSYQTKNTTSWSYQDKS